MNGYTEDFKIASEKFTRCVNRLANLNETDNFWQGGDGGSEE